MKNICLAFAIMITVACNSKDVVQIENFSWTRLIDIDTNQEIVEEGWDIPDGGIVISQRLKFHHTESYQCLEPYYDVMSGDIKLGLHTCTKNINETWYTYRICRWLMFRQVTARSSGRRPVWPMFKLAEGEREGKHTERYFVYVKLSTHRVVAYECEPSQWEELKKGGWYNALIRDDAIIRINEEVLPESSNS